MYRPGPPARLANSFCAPGAFFFAFFGMQRMPAQNAKKNVGLEFLGRVIAYPPQELCG